MTMPASTSNSASGPPPGSTSLTSTEIVSRHDNEQQQHHGASGGFLGPSRVPTENGFEIRRITSRANIIRQNSVSLLRRDITPTLLRKTSGLNLFAPPAEEETPGVTGIRLFYYTGWNSPYLHYRSCDELTAATNKWTTPPGIPMAPIRDLTQVPVVKAKAAEAEMDPGTAVWSVSIPDARSLEFVPNNCGLSWDKAPGNTNYRIFRPGCYVLRHGCVTQWVAPPQPPLLLKAEEVKSSWIQLSWNPPVERQEDVEGYCLYRDGKLVATLEGPITKYKDLGLTGLTKYAYTLKAFNMNGEEGRPSDELVVITGEPGRPSPPENLRVMSHSTTKIELAWQPPLDDGGAPIQAYRIYRDGKPTSSRGATALEWDTWTDVTVQPNQRYVYNVTACHEMPPMPSAMSISMGDAATTTSTSSVVTSPSGVGSLEAISAAVEADVRSRNSQKREGSWVAEGCVSPPVEARSVPMVVVPRLGDKRTHIILQGFTWTSCTGKEKWYVTLKSWVERIQMACITMLWLPPPSASVAPQGYMPTRWYDLDGGHGSELDLKSLISELKNHEVVPMLDLVVNHRCGTKQDKKGQWTIFEKPDWESWAIVSNNAVGYEGRGACDSGASSECAPDIDHTNKTVRSDIKQWTKWLFESVGFGALRIDMAPGYGVNFQVEYVEALDSPFTVGEYWSGDVNVLHNYTKAGRGRLGAFDFALYYVLRRAIESSDFGELNCQGRPNGLLGKDPERAVTFIENHDTEHLSFVGKFAGGSLNAIYRGYVYLLTHPGTPCVYWDDFQQSHHNPCPLSNSRNIIAELCQIRRRAGLTSTCSVHIAAAQRGLYAAYVSKDRYCSKGGGQVAVKIGWENWAPEGKWRASLWGKDFCVWERV